ncbi:MAG: hypothetical protein JWM80_6673 [Cyanobacteria bacterium RYN_339]|nr:hypothetical protein [Cyanobacteria bacterium RYN_339]
MRFWLLLAVTCSACAPVALAPQAQPSGPVPPRATVGVTAQANGSATPRPAEIPDAPAPFATATPTTAPTAAPVATAAPQIAQLLPQLPALATVPTPQPTPPAAPSLVGPVSGIHEGGVVFAKDNPFGFPASIGVGGPDGLLGTNKYGLLAASQGTPAQVLLVDALPYFVTRILVDAILTAVAAAQLEVGRDYVFDDHDKPGKFLTVRVDVLADHALLSVWRGKLADPARQLIAIRWTDARHGQATFHTLSNDDEPKRTAVATRFDRASGSATVDMVVDDPHGDDQGGPQQSANHLELRATPGQGAGTTAYSLRSGLTIHKASEVSTPSVIGVAANWLEDGRGAFWVAVGNKATGNKLLFWPADNASFGQTPPAAHDFYVSRLGFDLPRILAGPLLKGIVPADSELPTAQPADPGVGAPFDDPKLAFPK